MAIERRGVDPRALVDAARARVGHVAGVERAALNLQRRAALFLGKQCEEATVRVRAAAGRRAPREPRRIVPAPAGGLCACKRECTNAASARLSMMSTVAGCSIASSNVSSGSPSAAASATASTRPAASTVAQSSRTERSQSAGRAPSAGHRFGPCIGDASPSEPSMKISFGSGGSTPGFAAQLPPSDAHVAL